MKRKKVLMTGNEAIAEGAIQAGCRFYAGYPITPQNELINYMARRMTQTGGVFIQAESELSAVNMVLGASAVGIRAMTSSSSPGISLMQEGISYIAGCQLPCLIINIMRGGPGLGNIAPSQSDYFQATKSGGHGDYHCIVLAPSSVQEAYDFVILGFNLADKYRNPVIMLADGMLGQMMELVQLSILDLSKDNLKNKYQQLKNKKWTLTGCKKRRPRVIKSFYIKEGDLEKFNLILQAKYKIIKKREPRFEALNLEDAKIILVGYGTIARILKSVIFKLRETKEKVGLIRPITLWPFPSQIFKEITRNNRRITILVVEMSYGQMLEDVKLAVDNGCRIEFLGRAGGGIPTEEEIINKIRKL